MKVEIIKLTEDTPGYEGNSDIIKISCGNESLFLRTRDAESYSSWVDKINEMEYNRLLKYKMKDIK